MLELWVIQFTKTDGSLWEWLVPARSRDDAIWRFHENFAEIEKDLDIELITFIGRDRDLPNDERVI